VGVSGLLDMRVLDDVTIEVNETEEVETQSGSESTQHPNKHVVIHFIVNVISIAPPTG